MSLESSASSSSSPSSPPDLTSCFESPVFDDSEPTTPISPATTEDQLVVPSNASAELNFSINLDVSEEERLILYSQAVYEYTRQCVYLLRSNPNDQIPNLL